jgi:hypothetical protein
MKSELLHAFTATSFVTAERRGRELKSKLLRAFTARSFANLQFSRRRKAARDNNKEKEQRNFSAWTGRLREERENEDQEDGGVSSVAIHNCKSFAI